MSLGIFTHRRVCLPAVVLITGALAVSGCATSQNLAGRFTDASDPCMAYRQPLIDTDKDFSTDMVTGAVVGALAGALLGAAIGGKNAGTGALIGAGAGALAGAGAGYLQAKQQESRNKEEVMRAIDKDAARDAQSLGKVGNAVRGLGQCRATAAERLAFDVETRKISRQQGLDGLEKLRQANAKDGELIEAVLGKADERVKTYVEARAQTMNPNNPQLAMATLTDTPRASSSSSGKKTQQASTQQASTQRASNSTQQAVQQARDTQTAAQESQTQSNSAVNNALSRIQRVS